MVGLIMGLLIGWLAARLIRRLNLDVEGLYRVFTIALVLLSYGLTTILGGSGFLAVYLTGLMQIAMFLSLGLLVFPSRLPAIMVDGLLITGIVVFIARPLSVFIALLFTKMSVREKLFVSWVGLRGAVPIVLATFPLLAGLPKATTLFDLVFFVVLASVLLQGTSVPYVAKWLKVIKV